MTNNCLVTKLKSSVDNLNLKKLGVLRVPYANVSSTQYIKIDASENIDIDVYLENGTLYESGKANSYIAINANQGVLYFEIKDKYKLLSLTFGNYNGHNVASQVLSRNDLPSYDDISYISNLTSISSTTVNCAIGDLANLEFINGIIDAGWFTGDLLDYIRACVLNGITTNEIDFSTYMGAATPTINPTLTFNNKTFTSWTYTSSSDFPDRLNWKVENNQLKVWYRCSNGTIAYTYGYTDEEITTLRTGETAPLRGVVNDANIHKVDD